ncbi:hypothetical protein [Gelatiniphilus marinus]|uniref:Uncharacterized protein n=1 Tax=Gelatiniphilus marinus TaxID=1759464 RepID=A0ABW5JQM3_9FLAO
MKNHIFVILIMLSFNFYGQEKICSNFKTGKFQYADLKYKDWKISRNDSIQIELNTKTRLKLYNSIVWKSDCEFVLTCYKALNTNVPEDFVGKIFHIEITETFNNGYYCIAKNKDIDDMHLKILKVK